MGGDWRRRRAREVTEAPPHPRASSRNLSRHQFLRSYLHQRHAPGLADTPTGGRPERDKDPQTKERKLRGIQRGGERDHSWREDHPKINGRFSTFLFDSSSLLSFFSCFFVCVCVRVCVCVCVCVRAGRTTPNTGMVSLHRSRQLSVLSTLVIGSILVCCARR